MGFTKQPTELEWAHIVWKINTTSLSGNFYHHFIISHKISYTPKKIHYWPWFHHLKWSLPSDKRLHMYIYIYIHEKNMHMENYDSWLKDLLFLWHSLQCSHQLQKDLVVEIAGYFFQTKRTIVPVTVPLCVDCSDNVVFQIRGIDDIWCYDASHMAHISYHRYIVNGDSHFIIFQRIFRYTLGKTNVCDIM